MMQLHLINYFQAIMKDRGLFLDNWKNLKIIERFKMFPHPQKFIIEWWATNQSSVSETELNYIRQSQLLS